MPIESRSSLALLRAASFVLACASSAGCATIFNSGASFSIERRDPILAVSENGMIRAGAFASMGGAGANARASLDAAPRQVSVQPLRCATTTLDVRTTQMSDRVSVRSPVGWGWFVLDVLLTVGIGAVVDAATGAWCYYEADE